MYECTNCLNTLVHPYGPGEVIKPLNFHRIYNHIQNTVGSILLIHNHAAGVSVQRSYTAHLREGCSATYIPL